MLALTPSDFNLRKCTLRIDKSYQRLHGEDVGTDPKTPKSIRTIKMSQFLVDEVSDYLSRPPLRLAPTTASSRSPSIASPARCRAAATRAV